MNRIVMILFTLFVCNSAFAQRIVIDKKSLAQVGKNATAAVAQEELIKKEFRAIKEEQNKVRNMIMVIERHLDKVDKVQRDISAFRKEGPAIQLFVLKLKRATKELKHLATALKNNPKGATASARIVSSLSMDIYGISSSMVSTVIDAQFSVPGLPKPKASVNLLEPQERLAFFERCCYDMDIITFKIRQMQLEIECTNTVNDILLKMSPATYSNYSYGRAIYNDITRLWQN